MMPDPACSVRHIHAEGVGFLFLLAPPFSIRHCRSLLTSSTPHRSSSASRVLFLVYQMRSISPRISTSLRGCGAAAAWRLPVTQSDSPGVLLSAWVPGDRTQWPRPSSLGPRLKRVSGFRCLHLGEQRSTKSRDGEFLFVFAFRGLISNGHPMSYSPMRGVRLHPEMIVVQPKKTDIPAGWTRMAPNIKCGSSRWGRFLTARRLNANPGQRKLSVEMVCGHRVVSAFDDATGWKPLAVAINTVPAIRTVLSALGNNALITSVACDGHPWTSSALRPPHDRPWCLQLPSTNACESPGETSRRRGKSCLNRPLGGQGVQATPVSRQIERVDSLVAPLDLLISSIYRFQEPDRGCPAMPWL